MAETIHLKCLVALSRPASSTFTLTLLSPSFALPSTHACCSPSPAMKSKQNNNKDHKDDDASCLSSSESPPSPGAKPLAKPAPAPPASAMTPCAPSHVSQHAPAVVSPSLPPSSFSLVSCARAHHAAVAKACPVSRSQLDAAHDAAPEHCPTTPCQCLCAATHLSDAPPNLPISMSAGATRHFMVACSLIAFGVSLALILMLFASVRGCQHLQVKQKHSPLCKPAKAKLQALSFPPLMAPRIRVAAMT